MVADFPANIKVTTPEDLIVAEAFLKNDEGRNKS